MVKTDLTRIAALLSAKAAIINGVHAGGADKGPGIC
jgi:hypothetical protein